MGKRSCVQFSINGETYAAGTAPSAPHSTSGSGGGREASRPTPPRRSKRNLHRHLFQPSRDEGEGVRVRLGGGGVSGGGGSSGESVASNSTSSTQALRLPPIVQASVSGDGTYHQQHRFNVSISTSTSDSNPGSTTRRPSLTRQSGIGFNSPCTTPSRVGTGGRSNNSPQAPGSSLTHSPQTFLSSSNTPQQPSSLSPSRPLGRAAVAPPLREGSNSGLVEVELESGGPYDSSIDLVQILPSLQSPPPVVRGRYASSTTFPPLDSSSTKNRLPFDEDEDDAYDEDDAMMGHLCSSPLLPPPPYHHLASTPPTANTGGGPFSRLLDGVGGNRHSSPPPPPRQELPHANSSNTVFDLQFPSDEELDVICGVGGGGGGISSDHQSSSSTNTDAGRSRSRRYRHLPTAYIESLQCEAPRGILLSSRSSRSTRSRRSNRQRRNHSVPSSGSSSPTAAGSTSRRTEPPPTGNWAAWLNTAPDDVMMYI